MLSPSQAPSPAMPTSRQLPRPLGLTIRPPAPPPTTVADLATHQIWPSLSPAVQHHLRQTLRRILQEVMWDANQP